MRARILPFAVVLALGTPAVAATITVGPTDNWTKIEAAQPGDVVEIAPGTYKFRVDFETAGTAAQPIVVRAQDPNNRPVWDLTGTPVGNAPGSYTAGDKGRGCWQFHAGHYVVDGIVFKSCIDHGSAGIRVINVPDVTIRNSTFIGNTNGVTGAGEPLVIEFSEFDHNGQALSGDQPAHQIYIFGGVLVVRFSYFHDSPAGQNFHVRARDATLSYNWLTRPGTYMGDLMSCEFLCGGTGTGPITQRLTLRGNVIVQGMPQNSSQLIALFNDEGASSDNTGSAGNADSLFDVTLVHNTIIGKMGATNNAVVHMLNDSVPTAAHVSNNLIINFKQVSLVENLVLGNATVDGAGNWATTGTDVDVLTGSHFGADPTLSAGYVPLPGSPVIGTASATASAGFEYYRDETVKLQGRVRATSLDPGAFESTTNSTPFDGNSEPTDGGAGGPGGGGSGLGPPTGGSGGTPTSGCGCSFAGSTPPTLALLLAAGLLTWVSRRRRRR